MGWLEIADPPKWDPRNRETADHSLAYEIARALVDGEIWIDSFGPDKLMDPAVRALMDKITASANPDYSYHGQVRMTVRNKAGAELVRELGRNNTGISLGTPVTHDEIVAKFNRVFTFMQRLGARSASGRSSSGRTCAACATSPSRSGTLRGSARRRRSDLDWPEVARASPSCLRPGSRPWPCSARPANSRFWPERSSRPPSPLAHGTCG